MFEPELRNAKLKELRESFRYVYGLIFGHESYCLMENQILDSKNISRTTRTAKAGKKIS